MFRYSVKIPRDVTRTIYLKFLIILVSICEQRFLVFYSSDFILDNRFSKLTFPRVT